MSAIFGVLRFDDAAVARGDLERMGNVLAHHAVHRRAIAVGGAVGFGHCLTRVNREDRFEAQPLSGGNGRIMLVADLRLDNREGLAQTLGIAPAALRDMPDSELVLRAYGKWGGDCASRLLGDFAFALWDAAAGKLILGRDHMGQRAVHYYLGPDFLAFATEIKALWALAGVPRQLSVEHVGRYLMWEMRPRGSTTAYESIRGIPGGSTLTVGLDRSVRARRYWEPGPAPEHAGRDEAYYTQAYRDVLGEAVACRLRRLLDPPALCHGGGFDSSAIAGLAGPALAESGRKLIAVSCVMPEDYKGPLRHPRRWVEMCRRHMPHLDVRYFIRRGETIFTDMEKLFHASDYPMRGPNFLHDAMFGMAATAGARLVMDGIGGDDTINPRGDGLLAHLLKTGRFGRFLREFAAYRRATGATFLGTLKRQVVVRLLPAATLRWWNVARNGFRPSHADMAIAPDFAARLFATGAADRDEVGFAVVLPSLRELSLRALRRGIEWPRRRLTNEAAIHGLSMTRPFLDKRVVELGLAVPEDLYGKNGRNRHLVRRALADLYPPEFQTRDNIADPLLPDQIDMLRSELPRLRAEADRLSRDPALAHYIDFGKLRRMLEETGDGRRAAERLTRAARGVMAARYIAWFEGRNIV
ncbi:MAG: asparagine synthase-related protein [Rhizomicrobium sp.]